MPKMSWELKKIIEFQLTRLQNYEMFASRENIDNLIYRKGLIPKQGKTRTIIREKINSELRRK